MHQIRQNARPTSGAIDDRDRAARRSTSALVGRSCRSSIDKHDRRTRTARRSTSDAIVWRAHSSIDERRARSLIALFDRRSRSCTAPLVGAARRDLGSLFSLSLSLSLFFRKWFEVKMRGENDFRVKGENIGQPEVIFRKMIFSVTAKHSDFMENDFRKQFSPDSNTP